MEDLSDLNTKVLSRNSEMDVKKILDNSLEEDSKPKTQRWKICSYILAYQACEVMVFYGIASTLVIYLTTVLHQGIVSAVSNVNNWLGVAWITPLLGAYLGDTHLGCYLGFSLFALAYLPGIVLLNISVWLPSLRPQACQSAENCSKASDLQVGLFFASLYIIAIASGATKPNITAIGADQFGDYNERDKQKKASFFNWWMFTSLLGTLISLTLIVYVQDNVGYRWGYAILGIAYTLTLSPLIFATSFFKRKPPKANPFREILEVLVAATRKFNVEVPPDARLLYELDLQDYESNGRLPIPNTKSLRWLDKAATKLLSNSGPWNLCPVTQVEQTKLLVKLIPFWICNIIPFLMQSQVNTLFIKQAFTMNRKVGKHFEIPASSLGILMVVPMMITIVVYDKLIIEILKRFTGIMGGITVRQRIGIGFGVQMLSMVAASIADSKRLELVRKHGLLNDERGVIPVSVFMLAPQFVLFGVSIALYEPALIQFFYEKSPDNMKSTSTAMLFLSTACGYFLSSVFITVINRISGGDWVQDNLNASRLDYYYGLLSIVSFLNLSLFVVLCRISRKSK